MARTISFVDENDLMPIHSKGVLLDIMSRCEKDKKLYLSNLDLSGMDNCCSICFDGYKLENIVFSKFSPDKSEKRHLFNLSFVGAELKNVSFEQAYLQQCNFDTMDVEAYRLHYKKMRGEDIPKDKADKKQSTLNDVDFFFSDIVLGYGLYGMLRKGSNDDYNIIFHSLYNCMGPHDRFTDMVPLPWASFESILGILLIGFLGFIIANNNRNDS